MPRRCVGCLCGHMGAFNPHHRFATEVGGEGGGPGHIPVAKAPPPIPIKASEISNNNFREVEAPQRVTIPVPPDRAPSNTVAVIVPAPPLYLCNTKQASPWATIIRSRRSLLFEWCPTRLPRRDCGCPIRCSHPVVGRSFPPCPP